MKRFYPIGTPGEPWNDADKRAWFESRSVVRSYQEEVLAKLDRLDASFERIGLDRHLSPNRRNGFYAMIEEMRRSAAVVKAMG